MADMDYNSIIQQGIDKVINSKYRAGAAVGADMLGVGIRGLESANQTAATIKNNEGRLGIEQGNLDVNKGMLGVSQDKQRLEERKFGGKSGIMRSMLDTGTSSPFDWSLFDKYKSLGG